MRFSPKRQFSRPPSGLPPTHPAWVRWLALAFVLLFGAASTAEASHLHGLSSSRHHVQAQHPRSQSDNGEEHCPLCVAMHSALPAPMGVAPAPLTATVTLPRVYAERDASSAWHFPNFSRPPPACG